MIGWIQRLCAWVAELAQENDGEHIHIAIRRGLDNDRPSAQLATVLNQATGDCEQRRNAAYDLGFFASQEALPVLLKLLSDSDEYVRMYAIQSIVRLNEPSAVPDLVLHAKSTQPGLVLTNIMRALAELRDRRATPVLCELLSSTEPMVRYDAAFALGEIQDPESLEALAQWTTDNTMPTSSDDVETVMSVGQMVQKAIRKIKRGNRER